jgi:hypothetical protein
VFSINRGGYVPIPMEGTMTFTCAAAYYVLIPRGSQRYLHEGSEMKDLKVAVEMKKGLSAPKMAKPDI